MDMVVLMAYWFAVAFIVIFTAFVGGVFWGARMWARARTRANTKFQWDAVEGPIRRDIWRALAWYLFRDEEKGEWEVVD